MKTNLKKLFQKYNKADNYIVISEFPLSKKHKLDTGLSRYSQNTIIALKNNISNRNRKTIILANIIDKEEVYEYENMLVIRCIKRNDLLSLSRLPYYALKLNKVKTILFEFEFAAYGNIKMSAAIPFVLLAFRLLGKKVFFALHQVAPTLSPLHAHLNLAVNSPILYVLEKGLQGFYVVTGILSNKIIVLEGEFKSRLSKFVNSEKIEVIPHGIEQAETAMSIDKKNMGFNNDDFIILAFGYIAWYKGLDDLINAFNKLPAKINGKTVKLIIAGGKSVAQKGKPHYENYYKQIIDQASSDKRITLTGFVAENEVKNYFDIADLCVSPYKTFISSSGPLSLAITYQKPIVLSKNLAGYLKSEDFASAFKESKLDKNELFINITTAELKNSIKNVITDKNYRQQMQIFTKKLLKLRNWNLLINNYSDLLFSNPKQAFNINLILKKLRLDFI